MRYLAIFLAQGILLAGCSSEKPDEAVAETEIISQKQLEKDAKSIEEAADAAAKLIEDDVKLEIGSAPEGK